MKIADYHLKHSLQASIIPRKMLSFEAAPYILSYSDQKGEPFLRIAFVF